MFDQSLISYRISSAGSREDAQAVKIMQCIILYNGIRPDVPSSLGLLYSQGQERARIAQWAKSLDCNLFRYWSIASPTLQIASKSSDLNGDPAQYVRVSGNCISCGLCRTATNSGFMSGQDMVKEHFFNHGQHCFNRV